MPSLTLLVLDFPLRTINLFFFLSLKRSKNILLFEQTLGARCTHLSGMQGGSPCYYTDTLNLQPHLYTLWKKATTIFWSSEITSDNQNFKINQIYLHTW